MASRYLYCSSVPEFIEFVKNHEIEETLKYELSKKFDNSAGESEISSWKVSLKELSTLLDDNLFNDTYIFLEFGMPLSSARCDVIIVGEGSNKFNSGNAVIIELKQWSYVRESVNRDCVSVINENFLHPSAQVRNYCNYLKYYHESFTEFGLVVHGCSFLHNMTEKRSIDLINKPDFFSTLPSEYPVFTKNETDKFKLFLYERLNNSTLRL